MSYALIKAGKVAAYPYSFARLRTDNPDVSFPQDPDDEVLARHGVVAVSRVPAPAPSAGKSVVELSPVFNGSAWAQAWGEVDATPEELALREAEARELTDRAAVKADAFVAAFIAMTPAQIDAYMDANVTTVAGAKAVMKKLAKIMLPLARREFG